jgi:hypothetical protein
MARHGATGAETWNEKANQKVVPDIETKENPGYTAWCRGGSERVWNQDGRFCRIVVLFFVVCVWGR